ncbi:MAG: glycosyltransferase [Saprospiraceae bacterium]|nr:glycosyltransferase [Saprospiraceae bacterium]
MESLKIVVLIPAWNEEGPVVRVIEDLPKELIYKIIVCDNGSTDRTSELAKAAGAEVVWQPERGYGNACLAGINYLKSLTKEQQPDIVVFLDGDHSDFPEELPLIIKPVIEQNKDLVIGSRLLGNMEPGAMTLPQRFGNWLAPLLIKWFFGYTFSDLGPFRAIKWQKLLELQMADRNYGWTVEMQVKAAKHGLTYAEVPVRYRKRKLGKSKVSGTVKGAILAGIKIIGTILKEKYKLNRTN